MLLLNQMTTQLKPAPQPRKLNNAVIETLSEYIRKGNYIEPSCAMAGISEPIFYQWLKLAENDEQCGLTPDQSIYLRLAQSIKKAEADAEAKLVAVVRDSAEVDRNWIAGMTFLERRHPDRWGRKDRTGPSTNININIDKALIDASGKMEEALTRLAERTQTYELDAPGELLQRGDDSRDTEGT